MMKIKLCVTSCMIFRPLSPYGFSVLSDFDWTSRVASVCYFACTSHRLMSWHYHDTVIEVVR